MTKKILTIVGARPQFIKAAVVSRCIKQHPALTEIMIHTGQHYDNNMSDVFFETLELPKPDYHLNIGSASHGKQTGDMLAAIEEVIGAQQPDCLLVYGDTNSTLAGALAAAKLHVPVAHVEAGLRSFNRRMPEEINRVLTDQLSKWLLCPTDLGVANLQHEGIEKDRIFQVGDVMYDAALYYGRKAEQQSRVLDNLNLTSNEYVLATVHRAENTDDFNRLKTIVEGLQAISKQHQIVLPLHPRTRKMLQQANLFEQFAEAVTCIDPVDFLDMMQLVMNSKLVVTDSGGLQKEAYFHGKACVTLRDETEWQELVELGWNQLAPPLSVENIIDAYQAMLQHNTPPVVKPYGEGNSSERIVDILAETL